MQDVIKSMKRTARTLLGSSGWEYRTGAQKLAGSAFQSASGSYVLHVDRPIGLSYSENDAAETEYTMATLNAPDTATVLGDGYQVRDPDGGTWDVIGAGMRQMGGISYRLKRLSVPGDDAVSAINRGRS